MGLTEMTQVKDKLVRILYLEDDLSAFELAKALIQSERIQCEMEHVDDAEAYKQILTENPPDLILADFNLPSIDGLTALTLKLELCPAVPFIFVSGSIGEEIAISSLRNGAADFVLKDSLVRLPSAVRRALQEDKEHTERMHAERRLRESEARFRRLTENAPDAIFRFIGGAHPYFEYISPAVTKISGFAPHEIYNDEDFLLRLYHPEDAALMARIWESQEVPSDTLIIRWINKQAKEITTEQRLVGVEGEDGRLIAIEGIARDISEQINERENRRQLEAQLFQAQKLESIGTLAGGIAHDFNNILTGILGFTELASAEIEATHPAQNDLGEIKTAGLRAKDLVRQILTFTRKNDLKATPIDLRENVDEVLNLIRATTPRTIELVRKLEKGSVRADATQLHQVILNLCTNAVHAMKGKKGILTVSVFPRPFPKSELADIGHIDPGSYMVLSVRDTGHGMDEATRKRIFDPFFTTKGAGEGTGLGLALAQNIVSTHGGAIRITSQLGEGTCFEVLLPEVSANEIIAEEPIIIRRGNGERIAVLDDETSIASYIAVRLEQFNYVTQVFKDPPQALTALLDKPSKFDALITDYTMPVLTGTEVIRRMRSAGVLTPAILTSGDDTPALKEEVNALGSVILVPKPFTGEQLAQGLQQSFARNE